MIVRSAQPKDAADWQRLRQALWPSPDGEHEGEIARFFRGELRNLEEALLAIDDSGRAVGFVELSIRSFAEGCYSERVGYLEGWFVESAHRRKGIGSALVKAAEDWARGRGCTEFASDTDLDNTGSAAAHRSLSFEEVGRAICFRKAL